MNEIRIRSLPDKQSGQSNQPNFKKLPKTKNPQIIKSEDFCGMDGTRTRDLPDEKSGQSNLLNL